MAVDVEKLPHENRAVYQLIMKKTNGNVSEFAKLIDEKQQSVNRLFKIDKRSNKYPSVSDAIIDSICKTFGLSWDDIIRPTYENVISEYPQLVSESRYVNEDIPSYEINYKVGKGFYESSFTMGYNLPFNDNTANPDYLINFKPLNNCDFFCRATGDSMLPTISEGDIVALKQVVDFSKSIVNREIYGIVLYNDLRAIKRLIDKGDSFILVSDNKDYEDQVISKSDVRYIYRVMGTIKTKLF